MYALFGAAWIPTLCFLLAGLALLILEMFTPGIGAAGVGGLVCLLAVIVLQLGWGNPAAAWLVVAIALILFILALLLFIRSFRKGRLSRSSLILQDTIDKDAAGAKAEEDSLVGRTGTALTPLRPSGTALFGEKKVSVSADGAFIPAGAAVEITGQNGLALLVREAKKAEDAQ